MVTKIALRASLTYMPIPSLSHILLNLAIGTNWKRANPSPFPTLGLSLTCCLKRHMLTRPRLNLLIGRLGDLGLYQFMSLSMTYPCIRRQHSKSSIPSLSLELLRAQ